LWFRSNSDEPETSNYRIVLRSPSGNESIIYNSKLALSESATHRNILFIAGIPFFSLGLHNFVIQLQDSDDWRDVGSSPFLLIKKKDKESSN
jgi:hypothetical protein